MSRSISREFRLISSLSILAAALLIGGSWAIIDYVNLKQESQLMRERLLNDRKDKLHERAKRAADFIEFYSKQSETRLKKEIKERTYEAYETATGLVNKYKGSFDNKTLHHLVRDSLRNIRYNDGRGYFFAINTDGTEELFADKPHLEGKNLTKTQDSNGQFVVQDMLKIAAEESEGFYTYTWTKPTNERTDNIKIAFVKYVPELDWVIGTGEYLEDVENDIKQEVLNSLDSVYLDPEGINYLFIGTWDGLILSRPAKDKNLLEIQDSNGFFIVKELIHKAKTGGGFIEYVMPKLKGERPSPKLSYVVGLPKWGWFIGTGEYIDNIDSELLGIRDHYFKNLQTHLLYIAVITITALLANLFIINAFSSRLRRQTNRFVDFFKQASNSPASIDVEAMSNEEFQSIGIAANSMLRERNKALAAHRESEERFRSAFVTIPDPVVIARLSDGEIIDVNTAFEVSTGIQRVLAIGHNSKDLGLWVDKGLRESFFEQLSKQKEILGFEVDFRVRGGQIKPCKLSARVFSLDNEPHMLVVIRDVSSEKMAERTLLEMDKIKSEFISTAAHELRTPLSAIMGFAEILIDESNQWGFSEDQKKDFIKEIYDRGDSLKGLIDDLLDISRIEGGQSIDLQLEDAEIGNVVSKSVDLFQKQNMEHTFNLSVQEELVGQSMKIDRHRITQVLENLLSNAVKYSPEGTTVSVTCKKLKHNIEVSVNDNGIGMTEDEIQRVFDKFYRADSSATAVSGLGLGMSIAKQIIESHNGKLWVDSIKGKGSTFTFSLPLSTED